MASRSITSIALDGPVKVFLYEGACDTTDTIAIPIGTEANAIAQVADILTLVIAVTDTNSGAVTRVDPEIHNNATPGTTTELWAGSWGDETPGIVWNAGGREPVLCSTAGYWHLQVQPNANGGTVRVRIAVERYR